MGIEYDGTAYNGWQKQNVGTGIQSVVENAVSEVADKKIDVICAGRTDSGVHAVGQVVHYDTTADRSEYEWQSGVNSLLSDDINVKWTKKINQDFHARFSAMARRYRYVIYNDSVRPAHLSREVTWNYRPLDIDLMRQAAQALLGTHDFTSYRAVGCQAKSPIKTIHHLELLRHGQFIVLDIRASAFLHHMVRNIVGVLMQIGCGERPVEWAAEVLRARDRAQGGLTAPAYGLYLVDVTYPEHFELPRRYLGPHFLSALPDVAD